MKSAVAFWALVLASLVAVGLGDARLAVEIGALALAVAGLAPDEAERATAPNAALDSWTRPPDGDPLP